jgi:hypothetical protein
MGSAASVRREAYPLYLRFSDSRFWFIRPRAPDTFLGFYAPNSTFGNSTMNDLLTLAEIAEMNRCSVRHARDVLVKLPGFPDEAPTSTPRNRLWLTKEVRAFIHRKPAIFPHTMLRAA